MTPEEKARFREQIAAIPAAPGGSVSRCAHCGRDVEEKIDPDMGGNHHRWWVHVPGGYTPCNPQQGARSTKAEPAPPEGLRERLAEALRTTPAREAATTLIDHTEHRYNAGCALCCGEADTLTAALLPVVEAHTAEQTARLGLPARLATALTERFTELGNPYAEMRIHEQGPDGWPSSRAVGPNIVADVLRELLAAGQQPTTPAPGYCPHCGRGDCAPTADDWLRQVERASKAEAAVARVRAECDRIEAAVRANPQDPDFDGAYLACLRHVRAALDGTGEAS